jgi:hypothetical protein
MYIYFDLCSSRACHGFQEKMGEMRVKNDDKKLNVKIFTKYDNVKCSNENYKIPKNNWKIICLCYFL